MIPAFNLGETRPPAARGACPRCEQSRQVSHYLRHDLSALRRTFSAVMLFGLFLFPLAGILSTSISHGSLSIHISTLTLILLGAGAAAALIGALGRSLVD